MKVTKNIFRLAAISSRITRVYYYHWRSPGTPQSAKKSTWDAGLITANGAARQALYVVAKALHRQIQTARPAPSNGEGPEPRRRAQHRYLSGGPTSSLANRPLPAPPG